MNDLAVLVCQYGRAEHTTRPQAPAVRSTGSGTGSSAGEARLHGAGRPGARHAARRAILVSRYRAQSDAYYITAPEPTGEGAIMSMRMAMREGGVNPDEIGYINAHGTSTPLNDKVETLAIRRCFEGCARPPLVSSTKSMTGHLLGAAGAVEAIFTVLSLSEGLFPATLGLRDIDEECALNHIIEKPAKNRAAYALSNSLGFGGHNSTLLIAAQ